MRSLYRAMLAPYVPQQRLRAHQRGLTLIEVLVSIGILALIGTLIYGAFDGMSRSRKGISSIGERYHQGRRALARMSREISSAYLSSHKPLIEQQNTRITAFIGKDQNPADRIDFASFAHRRFKRDSHESDQAEISYFVSRDPKNQSKLDLVRREQTPIDLDPERGGAVLLMAEDVRAFDLQYLDPVTGEWQSSWDTQQAAGQGERLPLQVHIHLEINGGEGDQPIVMATKVPVAMQDPINFAGMVPNNPTGSGSVGGNR